MLKVEFLDKESNSSDVCLYILIQKYLVEEKGVRKNQYYCNFQEKNKHISMTLSWMLPAPICRKLKDIVLTTGKTVTRKGLELIKSLCSNTPISERGPNQSKFSPLQKIQHESPNLFQNSGKSILIY